MEETACWNHCWPHPLSGATASLPTCALKYASAHIPVMIPLQEGQLACHFAPGIYRRLQAELKRFLEKIPPLNNPDSVNKPAVFLPGQLLRNRKKRTVLLLAKYYGVLLIWCSVLQWHMQNTASLTILRVPSTKKTLASKNKVNFVNAADMGMVGLLMGGFQNSIVRNIGIRASHAIPLASQICICRKTVRKDYNLYTALAPLRSACLS